MKSFLCTDSSFQQKSPSNIHSWLCATGGVLGIWQQEMSVHSPDLLYWLGAPVPSCCEHWLLKVHTCGLQSVVCGSWETLKPEMPRKLYFLQK